MPGININNLPQNLQQKLSPYVFVAKDIDSAIEMAKRAGNWSEADDKAYKALNGGANWGKVMDEFTFDYTKAPEYKKSANTAKATPKQKAKVYSLGQKSNTQRRAELKKKIAANKAEGGFKGYAKALFNAVRYHNTPDTDNVSYASSPYMALGALVLAVGTVVLTTSCEDNVNIETNIVVPMEAFTSALLSLQAQMQASQQKIIELLSQIVNNTDKLVNYSQQTNQSIAEILDYQSQLADLLAKINGNTELTNEQIRELQAKIDAIKKQLEEMNSAMLTIIKNQENSSKNADEFYKNLLALVGKNNQSMEYLIKLMIENNTLLTEIKAKLDKAGVSLDKIFEVISKCNYVLESLSEKFDKHSEASEKLLSQISETLANISTKLDKVDFTNIEKLLSNILDKIGDNTAQMESMRALLQKINNNAIANGKTQQEILTVLSNISAKMDNIDLSKVEKLLSDILDKVGNNSQQMEKITKLLAEINAQTKLNGQTQVDILNAVNTLGASISGSLTTIISKIGNLPDKMDDLIKLLKQMDANDANRNKAILDAIAKLNGDMTAQFNKLVTLGKENNQLQKDANKLIDEVIKAIKNFKPEIKVDLSELIECINANGADVSTKLSEIFGLLSTINSNVVQGDTDVNNSLQLILKAIAGKDPADFSKILEKLDAILAAIKDHKVRIHITTDGKCQYECDGAVNEGVIDDLEWLLG